MAKTLRETAKNLAEKSLGKRNYPQKKLQQPQQPLNQGAMASKSPSDSTCPVCGGVGFIRYSVPPEDDRFGRIYPCPSCSLDARYKSAGLTANEAQLHVSSLQTNGRSGTKRMIIAANEFYNVNMTGFLSLCGGYGVGKTHIMKAIAAEGVRRGWKTYYTTLYNLLMYVRDAYSSNLDGDSDLERLKRYKECRLLLLDEIDKVSLSEYAIGILTNLIDERYRKADQIGTVLAWNGGIDVIEKNMPWLASRLKEFVIFENNDSDFREILHELRSEKWQN